ncbi:MAG: ribonuclease H-like domain-containing protein [Thermoplasmata archaeon]
MRILHLPGESIRGYSESSIHDIFSYFEPDLTVTTGLSDIQRKIVHDESPYESIDLDLLGGFTKRVFDDEVFLALRDENALQQVDDLTEHRRTTILTDLIKEDMDPVSFDFRLTNSSLIDKVDEREEEIHLLSTEIETGKNPIHGGKTVHGFGPSRDLGDTKIPFLRSGKRPHIETLDSGKVGITAVSGLGRKFSVQLEHKGLVSREDLCCCEPSELLGHEGIGPYRSTKWISSAKAIEEREVYKIQRNDLEGKHRIFVDIETDSLNPRIIWHIGLFDDQIGEYRCFLEKDPDRKGRIIEDFLDYLEGHSGRDPVLLAWYGDNFDFPHLESFISEYAPSKKGVWNHIQKIDFMRWVDRHAALPCRSSKLESVAMRVGYGPELLGLDGAEVGKMYSEYMEDEDKELHWKELKLYGKEDVIAMKYIYDKIKEAPLLYDLEEVKKKYNR